MGLNQGSWAETHIKPNAKPQATATRGERILRKGDWLVCSENNHRVCQCSHDIHRGDTLRAEDFGNFQQWPKPDSGDVVQMTCTVCRSPWVRWVGTQLQVFEEWNGWNSR